MRPDEVSELHGPSLSWIVLVFLPPLDVAAVMQRDGLFPTGVLFNQRERAFSPSCAAMQRSSVAENFSRIVEWWLDFMFRPSNASSCDIWYFQPVSRGLKCRYPNTYQAEKCWIFVFKVSRLQCWSAFDTPIHCMTESRRVTHSGKLVKLPQASSKIPIQASHVIFPQKLAALISGFKAQALSILSTVGNDATLKASITLCTTIKQPEPSAALSLARVHYGYHHVKSGRLDHPR